MDALIGLLIAAADSAFMSDQWSKLTVDYDHAVFDMFYVLKALRDGIEAAAIADNRGKSHIPSLANDQAGLTDFAD